MRNGCATRWTNSPALAPRDGEEERLAQERQRLQQGERHAEAIAAALAELAPRDRRSAAPAAALRAACRALQRLVSPAQKDAANPAGPALAALERAEEALAEAESFLTRLAHEADADPRLLEQAEERLFALRAAARKHAVAVAELPALLDTLCTRLAALETGAAEVVALEQAVRQAREAYVQSAAALGAARRTAAARLDRAVAKELPPLRLDKARFHAEVAALTEADWGPAGTDAVRFLIATNPGQELGPLGRIASGGELSRLMLALKVVLSSGSPVPTLVFDEVDADVGGATAAAVGERLTRVAERVQVLVVTHSPQVAARGGAHMLVSKQAARGRTATRVDQLDATGPPGGNRAHAGRRDGHRGREGCGRRSAGGNGVSQAAAIICSPSPCGRGLGGGGRCPASRPRPPTPSRKGRGSA